MKKHKRHKILEELLASIQMKKHKRHKILEELLASIKQYGNIIDTTHAYDMAERIFNIQENDIDKLKAEYESLLMDYEQLTDNPPSVTFRGQSFDTEAIGILFEQQAAASRQIAADVEELEGKDEMIDAMIEGFNLRNRLNFDTYEVAGYDWESVVRRIKMSEEPNEMIGRIEQIEASLLQLKKDISNEDWLW